MTSTCLRIMSMVCMMQRGRRPWFLAKIIACSRVTFRVHLQRPKKAKGECYNVRAGNPDKEVYFEVFFFVRVITITLC